ncbi:hypothetical protein IQ37_13355 [Chryseobacterium piperi]|uniref:Uncharacterized protein n=1 Tax=Chryseobacterium piperi TaxID=558152 RepID=A0A086B621_9FLAO|nr:hypothetical protein [Chryseobacterium piperi]ASW74465.1 hypothetical protein CJF12_09350 [Chryseobacterium piperi]KFF24385.1 hypothetical protein IQ37_13355 [Chryseobacterium piperi]
MSNSNPIKTKDNGEYPEFIIPNKFKTKSLYITTKTELIKDGWELDLIHAFNIDGKTQDFTPTPDIERYKIGKGEDLNNKKFALVSIASRIRNGGENGPSKVKYTLKFEAGNELIDEEFIITSTEINPATFYTKITLKLEQ